MPAKKKARRTARPARQDGKDKTISEVLQRDRLAVWLYQTRIASKRARKPEFNTFHGIRSRIEPLNPLLGRQFVVGQEIMVARVLMKKGCLVPAAQPSQRADHVYP